MTLRQPDVHVRHRGPAGEEAQALLDRLFAHCLEAEHTYRHEWRVGDVLMWDNCSTWHKALSDYAVPQRRLMHRTAVTGDEPY